MPKHTHIKSILIIGSGPIVIGQACEFDYAGTQACKALRAEGFRIILINSNPATIMTDSDIADAVYIEPITESFVTEIIKKERPDALLPTLGGQTALNCALQLAKSGVLDTYHVKLIGASVKAIEIAEDRQLFQKMLSSLQLNAPTSMSFENFQSLKNTANEIAFPAIVRSSFSLGGAGASFVDNAEELLQCCEPIFNQDNHALISVDTALTGWKEIELEVMRDQKDNCIVVCGIENINPLGVHTGDSITVAPIQTLTDKEYQLLREAAFKLLRALGIDTGGCNVQFALHPETGEVVVIEMNPRVSRSSALVSKASGFPIAKIAAKLAVGFTLDELQNDITAPQLPASFEPTLDYVVVKIPRFHFEKFPGTTSVLGPQMQSVGEAMAIGRTFSESLQKAMRSLEHNQETIDNLLSSSTDEQLQELLKTPSPLLLYAIMEAFKRDASIADIYQITYVDPWFLSEINQIILLEKEIRAIKNLADCSREKFYYYKQAGFSDAQLASLFKCSDETIKIFRDTHHIQPVYKRIDSCAGEFKTPTAYFYGTYETVCESEPTDKAKIIIIGSGPNRIGQGIEFDYCCVQAAKSLRHLGFETIMLNCNPETVSTDYDVVDRLYCTPLTFEDVYDIIQCENPQYVLLAFGGQTPLNLAEQLSHKGIALLGIDAAIIKATEDRQKFKDIMQALSIKQPKNCAIMSVEEGMDAADTLNFPLIIRPSFILGGRAMHVVGDKKTLEQKLLELYQTPQHHPVLLENFLQRAIEIDVDAICDGKEVFVPAILEHIEEAGIHSGDSACITPPVSLSIAMQKRIREYTKAIALYLKVQGIINIQFAVVDNDLYVLEVNPRASRTVPFVCKATQLPIIDWAIKAMFGESLTPLQLHKKWTTSFYYVKESVLPFNKFPYTSTLLGPEMRSTGEVMGIGLSYPEAYAKALSAAYNELPLKGKVWVVCDELTFEIQLLVERLQSLAFQVQVNGDVPGDCSLIFALKDPTQSNVNVEKAARFAVDHKICYVTSLRAAKFTCEAIQFIQQQTFSLHALHSIRKKQSIPHLLTGLELSPDEIKTLITDASILKRDRALKQKAPLLGKHLALIFDKPSLRTRSSFTVAMRELGGDIIESSANSRKQEDPRDQAGVLGGYCHGIVVRTDQDQHLQQMAAASSVPVINGLTDLHHPCQILADLLTLQELFGDVRDINLAYIGDGNNILHSLMLIAPLLGIHINFACPETRGPQQEFLNHTKQSKECVTGSVRQHRTPKAAVFDADVIYTDVWTSMGFEGKVQESLFEEYQVNASLMEHAKPYAFFMHCLPMVRGKEVHAEIADSDRSVIYQQSENRLHMQKAILLHYLLR